MQGAGRGIWLDALSGLPAFSASNVALAAWDSNFDVWSDRGDDKTTYFDGTVAPTLIERPFARQRQRGNTPAVAFTSGLPANVANFSTPIPCRGCGGGTSFYFCFAFSPDAGSNLYYTSLLGDAAAAAALGNVGWHLGWNSDEVNPLELSIGTGAARTRIQVPVAGWTQFTNMPQTRYVIDGYLSGTTLALRLNKGSWVTATVGAMSAGVADCWIGAGGTNGFNGGGYFSGDVNFLLVRRNDVPDATTRDQVVNYAQAVFGGTLFSANTAYTSSADPASYTHSVAAATKDNLAGLSFASPAVYSLTGFATVNSFGKLSSASPAVFAWTPAATGEVMALSSIASPAVYALTGAATTDSVGKFSIASPAVYALTANAATSTVQVLSKGLPAVYAMTGVAATSTAQRVSNALPGVYSYTPPASKDYIAAISPALPAVYLVVANDAVSIHDPLPWNIGIARPAVYAMTGFAATGNLHTVSQAIPATYLMQPFAASVDTTGHVEVPIYPPPVAKPALTDAEFLAWLVSEDAIRTVIVETQCIDADGNSEQVFIASRGFVTKLEDGREGRYYEPLLKGGLDFQQTISLNLQGDQSYGDIELDNADGELDWTFDRYWMYQPFRAYVGDARWPRRDFRQIFDGAIEDIDSSARDTINVRLRDKLHRLDVPLHDEKVGGSAPDPDRLLPVAFGECHNITPVLQDAPTLRYVYHSREAESVFEVRDNGIPIQRVTANGKPARFTLPRQPYGRVTASIQGDKTFTGGYVNTVSALIRRIVEEWGTEPSKRLTEDDIDIENFDAFELNNPQPVGIYIEERATVLDVCNSIAASVGARLTMTATGKLQLVKVQVPPIGTPINVDETDMLEGSLMVADRTQLMSGVKLGFCKNWTVQPDTAAGLPEEHKSMFSREWYTTSLVNPTTRDTFALWDEPEQENTLLLDRDDAAAEAGRRLWLRSYQRHVYEFEGFSNLIFTQVGAPMRITHRRFGLQGGKTGQVVYTAVDWIHATVKIGVLI